MSTFKMQMTSSRKGSQIQMINKTIIEYEELLKPRFVLSASAFGR